MLQYRQYSEHLLGAPAAIDDHTINVDKPNTPTLLRRRTPRNSNFLHENDNGGPAHPQEERDVEENPQPLVNPALPAPPNSPPRPKVASVGPSVPTNATGKERATDDGCEGLGSSQQPALTPPPQTVVLKLTDTTAQRRKDLQIARSSQHLTICNIRRNANYGQKGFNTKKARVIRVNKTVIGPSGWDTRALFQIIFAGPEVELELSLCEQP